MTEISEILKHKKALRSKILKEIAADKGARAVIFNAIKNPEIRDFIENACQEIQVACIRQISPEKIAGLDAVVCDFEEENDNIKPFLEQFVTPIFPQNTDWDLAEFDPMKFSGNAFLFSKNNKFLIFEKICRMLENMNYAGDRRVLLKNLVATF